MADAVDDAALLAAVQTRIAAAPHSAAALTLYALVNTLAYENAGCLFKLNKLRDLGAEDRQLAFALIELMVREGNQGPDWEAARAQLDALVRRG